MTGAMKSSSQAKSIIKDKGALSQNWGKELFGKDIGDQVIQLKRKSNPKNFCSMSLSSGGPANRFKKASAK